MFQQAQRVWLDAPALPDEFGEFRDSFRGQPGGRWQIRISCDTDYALWCNGQFVDAGQYLTWPGEASVDILDLSEKVREGENILALVVWYGGKDTSCYKAGDAGVIFEVLRDGVPVAFSGPKTEGRLSRRYESHREEKISGQLGWNYHCDLNASNDWMTGGGDGFSSCRVVNGPEVYVPRPVEKLVRGKLLEGRPVQQGILPTFPARPVAEAMQKTPLAFRFPEELTGKTVPEFPLVFRSTEGDGLWFILDLGEESVGWLSFDLTVPDGGAVWVGYSEHLADGRCRTGRRNYTFDFIAAPGRNRFFGPFRRLACRYLQFYVESKEVTVHSAGIIPTDYPLRIIPFNCGNLLRQTIDQVCLRTLQLCMHEHYEDCPSREQALYILDSRNQMLCGYYAFGEYRFPKACLELIRRSRRTDGLLSLTSPGGNDWPIPFFSLIYPIQVEEYVRYSGDIAYGEELLPFLNRLLDVFRNRIFASGVCTSFPGSDAWNFFEWADTMDGEPAPWARKGPDIPENSAPLSAALSLALERMADLCDRLGKSGQADALRMEQETLNRAIVRNFYDETDELFRSFSQRHRGTYSVLTNALCLLCGAAPASAEKVCRLVAENGGGVFDVPVVPASLSMACFRYDGLLRANREKYRKEILAEIDRVYLFMLRQGATSVWETMEGQADFHGAGSLCHGWSGLPVYYYRTLLTEEKI